MPLKKISANAPPSPLPASSGPTATVLKLARTQLKLEQEVATLETKLKEAKAQLRRVAEEELPEAMGAADVTALTLGNGWRLELDSELYASIPKAQTEAAFAWLRTHGHGALIKRELTLQLPRGQEEVGDLLLEQITQLLTKKKLGHEVSVEDHPAVHPQTLKAFVREQMAEGSDLPLETFGVFQRRVAKLIPPKKTKEIV